MNGRVGTASDHHIRVAVGNQLARLGDCEADWCELTAGGYTGWGHKSRLWGVDAD